MTRTLVTAAALAAAVLTFGEARSAPQTPGRVVAVGDIHGDLDRFTGLLEAAGLADASGRWRGGNATLVVTGDYMDRGTQVRAVMDRLMALEEEASAAGGRLHVLLGNHEVMNLIGERRDVSEGAYAEFATPDSPARLAKAFEQHAKVADTQARALNRLEAALVVPPVYQTPAKEAWMAAHPPGLIEYVEAMAAGGRYGRWLRARPTALKLGDTLFLHGGLNPDVVEGTVDDINERIRGEISRFDALRARLVEREQALPFFTAEEVLFAAESAIVRAQVEAIRSASSPEAEALMAERAAERSPLRDARTIPNWWIVHPDGPLWFRGFANWSDEEGNAALDRLAQRYGVARIVVGHSITATRRITPRFGSRVFLIDTALSIAYKDGRPSALELKDGTTTAIYLEGREPLAP